MGSLPQVHLYNPLTNTCGGSEWHTFSLFEILADYGPVDIWTNYRPDPRAYGRFPIQLVDPSRRLIPRGGVFVLVGAYFGAPAWLPYGQYDRIILIYNIPDKNHLDATVPRLKSLGVKRIETLTVSNALIADLKGYDVEYVGTQYSPIDIERFTPCESRPDRPFTIGRLSRDVPEKFHPDDPELYLRLAGMGFKLRIMGGTCLRSQIGSHPSIDLIPEGAEKAQDFFHNIDAFIYRTAPEWYEAFGRVIVEAMASGVVPIAHHFGGYAEVVDSGTDGVLYDTHDEAVEWFCRLRDDPELFRKMSANARESAVSLFGANAKRKLAEFYFGKLGD